MWIAFTVLAAVFFVVFLLSVFLNDRPPSQATRQFNPLQGVQDWGTDRATKHLVKEADWQRAQASYERVQQDIEEGEHLRNQQHQITLSDNEITLKQREMTKQDMELAKAQGIDPGTLVERRKLELQHEFEMKKLMETTQVEVQKHREMKQIDVQAYAHEIQIDLQAALTKRILDHKTVRRIEAEFQELVRERAEIETDKALTPHSRQLALGTKDAMIEAFRKNLNEQMERRLLQAGDGTNVQGMDAGS